MAKAKRVYVCETCGALAEEPGHLCNPKGEAMGCTFCGEKETHPLHYCKGRVDSIKYVCDQCGRLAEKEDFLCKPKQIP